jgi:transcriptional regulator with XRE-family HTH domain
METIEKRLVAFRESTGLSKKAFADKIGMDSGLYGRYEGGTNKPSFDTLEKIAIRFAQLNLNWLLTGKGEMLLTAVATAKPVEGLTSGPATVAEAENILLRQQVENLTKTVDRLWGLIPSKLGKMLSSSDAAHQWLAPLAPGGGQLVYGG